VDHYGANERLDVIRTLMERSAIYRRALAPVMLMLGALGIGGGAAGYFFTTQTYLPLSHSSFFALYWMFISMLALALAFAQVRKQAVRDGEPFWSPPTRRVTQALAPALAVGAVLGLSVVVTPEIHWFLPPPPVQDHAWGLPPIWMLLYGVAVHSAGFFMPRGFKLFGWAFIATGAFVFLFISKLTGNVSLAWAHVLMGEIFGGAHLAYGLYLAITEKRYATA
jgi:hypothetical protein